MMRAFLKSISLAGVKLVFNFLIEKCPVSKCCWLGDRKWGVAHHLPDPCSFLVLLSSSNLLSIMWVEWKCVRR